MHEHLAIEDMAAALKTALADCVSGSECQRLLEECLQIVDSLGASEASQFAVRVARARAAAQKLRQASLQPCCRNRPSMENARHAMTSMLFAITQTQ